MTGQQKANKRFLASLISNIEMEGSNPRSWEGLPERITGRGEGRRCQGGAGSQPGRPAGGGSDGGGSLGVLRQADALGARERGEEGWVGAVVFKRSKCKHQRIVSSLERLGLAKLASSRTQQLAGPNGETAVVIEMEVERGGADLKLSGMAGTAVALRCRRYVCPCQQRRRSQVHFSAPHVAAGASATWHSGFEQSTHSHSFQLRFRGRVSTAWEWWWGGPVGVENGQEMDQSPTTSSTFQERLAPLIFPSTSEMRCI